MTFNPTKKRQDQWVKDHLNGGSFPEDLMDYYDETDDAPVGHAACYAAMEWLDANDIKTLEEAWDRCLHADWLAWMVHFMEPSAADALKWIRLVKKHVREDDWLDQLVHDVDRGSGVTYSSVVYECGDLLCGEDADVVRAVFPNPWRPKTKRKAVAANTTVKQRQ